MVKILEFRNKGIVLLFLFEMNIIDIFCLIFFFNRVKRVFSIYKGVNSFV